MATLDEQNIVPALQVPPTDPNLIDVFKKQLGTINLPSPTSSAAYSNAHYAPVIAQLMADPGQVNREQMKILPKMIANFNTPVVDETEATMMGAYKPTLGADLGKEAYGIRNTTAANMGKLVEETNKAAALPATIAKTWQEGATEAAKGAEHEAKAKKTNFEMTEDYGKLQALNKMYEKSAEQMGQHHADMLYADMLKDIPVPAEMRELGMRNMRDAYMVFGTKSAEVYSAIARAIGNIKAAGVTAGGMVAAAREGANLNGLLGQRRQMLENEEKELMKSAEKQRLMATGGDKAAMDAYKATQTRLQQIGAAKTALDSTMQTVQTSLLKKTGVEDKTGGGQSGYKVGDMYKGVKIEAIVNGKPVATDPSDGKRKYLK